MVNNGGIGEADTSVIHHSSFVIRYLQIQLQISLADPAQLAHELAEE